MTEPAKIDPDAFYSDNAASLALGVSGTAIDKARKAGELRYTRRAGRNLYLGKWLVEWLTADVEAVPA